MGAVSLAARVGGARRRWARGAEPESEAGGGWEIGAELGGAVGLEAGAPQGSRQSSTSRRASWPEPPEALSSMAVRRGSSLGERDALQSAAYQS